MNPYQLFEDGEIPEWTTPEWYAERDRADHLNEELHRPRLELTAQFVIEAANRYGLNTVSDLGCGDAGGLLLLKQQAPHLKTWGFDLQASNVIPAVEERGLDVRLKNILDDDIEYGDIAICTEVCEHLLDPFAFIANLSQHVKVVVASSPWTETKEQHYPFHTYAFSLDGYRELFETNGFRLVKQERVSMFQVVIAVKKDFGLT